MSYLQSPNPWTAWFVVGRKRYLEVLNRLTFILINENIIGECFRGTSFTSDTNRHEHTTTHDDDDNSKTTHRHNHHQNQQPQPQPQQHNTQHTAREEKRSTNCGSANVICARWRVGVVVAKHAFKNNAKEQYESIILLNESCDAQN